MFDFNEFYAKENDKAGERYTATVDAVRTIAAETEDPVRIDGIRELLRFYNAGSRLILECANAEKKTDESYFSGNSYSELKKENGSFYRELEESNYETSYANPSYSVKVLGDGIGRLYSFFYTALRRYIGYAKKHQRYKMEEANRIFLESYRFITKEKPAYEPLKEIITGIVKKKDAVRDFHYSLQKRFNPDFGYFRDLIRSAGAGDPRYLFRYHSHISDCESETAGFLSGYTAGKIQRCANVIVESYVRGFERNNKSFDGRPHVALFYNIGMERLIEAVTGELAKHGFLACISDPSSTPTNRQYLYDHRFDSALYLDEEYIEETVRAYDEALGNNRMLLEKYSGGIYINTFGEAPFCPVNKEETITFGEVRQKRYRQYQNRMNRLYNEYIPRTKTSFCIVAFPSPEIGDAYGEIFDETVQINTLDTDHYENIQQKMIDVLDKADSIRIEGKEENLTDLTVTMQPLDDPDTQTKFVNSGANVNIPVGEVFTSPRLQGTNGVLHVKEIYLRGLRYDNLRLVFKDGFVVEYSCTNFENEKENDSYIKDNLLFPHGTLPMGEFAIGTNTLAFAVSKKYNITDRLPILIIEKTGPHFALGDTCFSRREDHKLYNAFNNKEMTARDNEKSILRKTDPENAYANKHIDISLPYEEIGSIRAVMKDGEEKAIISGGRFVLEGTEELNRYLEDKPGK
ncbi:MAG: aminopeptidase [Spirochaetales bacterium]|nr:aminopeptidase [Spirochaetales bacterium]